MCWPHRKVGWHPRASPPPGADPFAREPLAGSCGWSNTLTRRCVVGLGFGLRTLCLEIVGGGFGSRAGVPARALAGTRAQSPKVGRRPRGQLPRRDARASSDPALPAVLLCVIPPARVARVASPALDLCFSQRNKADFYFMLLRALSPRLPCSLGPKHRVAGLVAPPVVSARKCGPGSPG